VELKKMAKFDIFSTSKRPDNLGPGLQFGASWQIWLVGVLFIRST
jgi:hypothetical protein